jgi:dTDP-4-dehydrorhamnose reductase
MSHVLVIGANGQLGREIKKMRNRFRQTYTFTDVEELDATDLNALNEYLASNPVDFLINCAAYTDVELAESEPEEAKKLNQDIVLNLKSCLEQFRSIRIIHISTDYGKMIQLLPSGFMPGQNWRERMLCGDIPGR